jgi:hypothetical protein
MMASRSRHPSEQDYTGEGVGSPFRCRWLLGLSWGVDAHLSCQKASNGTAVAGTCQIAYAITPGRVQGTRTIWRGSSSSASARGGRVAEWQRGAARRSCETDEAIEARLCGVACVSSQQSKQWKQASRRDLQWAAFMVQIGQQPLKHPSGIPVASLPAVGLDQLVAGLPMPF